MLPLDVKLRDRFVCGLEDAYLQQRLFAEKDLTFQKALDISLRSKSAKLPQQSIKGSVSQVNETGAKVPGKNSAHLTSDKPCYAATSTAQISAHTDHHVTIFAGRLVIHIEKTCIKKKATDHKSGPQW